MISQFFTFGIQVLLFFGFILTLSLGWFLSWKYTLSHIPVIREVFGLEPLPKATKLKN